MNNRAVSPHRSHRRRSVDSGRESEIFTLHQYGVAQGAVQFHARLLMTRAIGVSRFLERGSSGREQRLEGLAVETDEQSRTDPGRRRAHLARTTLEVIDRSFARADFDDLLASADLHDLDLVEQRLRLGVAQRVLARATLFGNLHTKCPEHLTGVLTAGSGRTAVKQIDLLHRSSSP